MRTLPTALWPPMDRLRTCAPRIIGAVLALSSLVACMDAGTPTPNPLLATPDLAGYQKVSGAQVADALRTGGLLSTVFGGDPRYAAVAAFTSQAAQCAIDHNIANLALYTQTADPTTAGVVLLVSNTQLTNPAAILACMPAPATDAPGGPCSTQYQFTRGNETYTVFYAATNAAVCTTLCQALPDCP